MASVHRVRLDAFGESPEDVKQEFDRFAVSIGELVGDPKPFYGQCVIEMDLNEPDGDTRWKGRVTIHPAISSTIPYTKMTASEIQSRMPKLGGELSA